MYHIRAILVAGVGFFLDSYDIFAINVITIWLGLAFWQGPPHDARYGFGGNNGTLPTPVSQTLKASTSAGIIVGMVLFGWLADTVGRRKMYGIELIIIVVSTLLCALVSPSQSMNSTVLLTFWRVMMVSLYIARRAFVQAGYKIKNWHTQYRGRSSRGTSYRIFLHWRFPPDATS